MLNATTNDQVDNASTVYNSIRGADAASCKTYNVKVNVRHLLREKRFAFGLLGQFLAYFALQFISPVLALRLADFGSTPLQSGAMFAIPSLLYVLHMPLISLYTRCISKRAIIITGFSLLSLSMLFIGNSKWLNIPESLTFTMVGLVMLGIGFSAIVVPIFPEMLEGVEQRHPQYLVSNELNDVAAGLFNASMGLGESVGPVISGVFNVRLGFASSQESLAILIAFFTMAYLVSCANQEICDLLMYWCNQNVNLVIKADDESQASFGDKLLSDSAV